MKKGMILSLSVLFLVVCSALVIQFLDVSCQLWSKVALSGSKKIGARLLLDLLQRS
ncbi:hypothetical protein KGY63_01675 [Candidatus Bipolaricaulota bacterium]|nr:hypothetical protein [Candidatus Bipolaricaulota bacterium]